jgi:hypothetical protein
MPPRAPGGNNRPRRPVDPDRHEEGGQRAGHGPIDGPQPNIVPRQPTGGQNPSETPSGQTPAETPSTPTSDSEPGE